MSNKNSGGLAFPCSTEQGANYPDAGMTLRDYFAAKAMHAVIVAIYSDSFRSKDDVLVTEAVVSEQAYHFADAMLSERAK